MKPTSKSMTIATVAALVTACACADTFKWVGNGADSFWGTDANWEKTEGDSSATKPGNADFAVFSQSEDLTVLLNEGSNVQGVRFEEGAGRVVLTLGDGWYNGRQLLFRRNMQGGVANPSIVNISNKSAYPFTIKTGLNATLNVFFGNAWGDFAMTPGVVFDCPVSAASDSNGWFLSQENPRTDNEEMNRTVFKRSANFYKKVTVGENHEVWISGDKASLSIQYGTRKDETTQEVLTVEESHLEVNGRLILDGSSVSVVCSNVTVGATGAIGGSGTIDAAVSAAYGAKLLFDSENVLTFTGAANLNGFTVDAAGLDTSRKYLVAMGTTSLPGVSAEHAAAGWMTVADEEGVYLVNNVTAIGEDVSLDADTDWTASVVSVAANVKIDLNGHDLYVAGIVLGEGVTFVNTGAEKSRVYAGLNGADKSWALDVEFPSTIMPVFCGAAIEIPAAYIPAGGIGFKDTAGAAAQSVGYETCANGFAFMGGANITEPFKSWQNGSFAIAVYGEDNVFTLNADNTWTKDGSFAGKPLSGDGTLTIASTGGIGTAYLMGRDATDNSGFTGRLVLKWGVNFGQQIEFSDPKTQAGRHFANATVALCGKDNGETSEFLLASVNGSSTANFCFDSLETEGDSALKVVLSTSCGSSGGTYLRVGTNGGGSGVFAGTFTKRNGNDERPYNIVKSGAGTWTLSGTVANGGSFSVESGCVEFKNGLADVTSLAVASGAAVLFAGDMGVNPIRLSDGATLKLDASNTGDAVPVVRGDLDLAGVAVFVARGDYEPSKTEPRELLRVTGKLSGFDRGAVSTDIDAYGWSFRLMTNEDGSKSLYHMRDIGCRLFLR